MRGSLTEQEIEQFLSEEMVARLGCAGEGEVYIVPITYVYHEGALESPTHEGKKLQMMRANPRVGIEVERLTSFGDWMTVVATGVFEEITGEEADAALGRLFRHIAPAMKDSPKPEENGPKPTMYRIRLETKSGRFERPD